MRTFRLALSFLTIIPVGALEGLDDESFGRSTRYFPVVGIIIGLILGGLYLVVHRQLTPLATDMLVVAALVILTRAFHMDAVADTFDGLLGGRDAEHSLAIMKDSRTGAFGVTAIVLVIGLKVLLLASVPEESKPAAIIAFPVIGRWAACFAMVTQGYARSTGGLGASFVAGAGTRELAIASLFTVLVAAGLLAIASVTVALVTITVTLLYIKMVNNKIGAMTGDTLGALIELTEVAVILAIALQ